MGGLTPIHLIIVLVVALLVIGPGKLPDTGAALGRAIHDFRKAVTEDVTEVAGPAAAVASSAVSTQAASAVSLSAAPAVAASISAIPSPPAAEASPVG